MNYPSYSFISDIIMSALNIETHHLILPCEDLSFLDHGLSNLLWENFDYTSLLNFNIETPEDSIYLYFSQNHMEQYYMSLRLPNTKTIEYLIFGPVLFEEPNNYFYERIISNHRISNSFVPMMKTYYSTVPNSDPTTFRTTVLTILSQFYKVYGDDNIKICTCSTPQKLDPEISSVIHFSMDLLEQRYVVENLLLNAITKGNIDEAIKYIHNFSAKSIPPRIDNPLRNQKNIFIILNTLCRKAVENASVHPFYIDQLSTKFAIQIEKTENTKKLNNLIYEMARKYCLLVQNYSFANYTQIIKKAVNYININISTPLSLTILANYLDVNATYLSSQFKKETGSTITEYIHTQRINAAIQLLNTTNHSIQEIAYRIGIDDLSYFSKLFKKQLGMSPQEYRKFIAK